MGAATSVTGAIGFIGLVAPHLARPFVGHQPSRILLPATLGGALLLLLADIAARLIHLGPELKLGVFTSLVGTPFFFWLVVRLQEEGAMSVLLADIVIGVTRGGRAILQRCLADGGAGRVHRRDRAQWRGQIHLIVGARRADRARPVARSAWTASLCRVFPARIWRSGAPICRKIPSANGRFRWSGWWRWA